jgi:glycosyltransferase involved in cell wall biosynthesis
MSVAIIMPYFNEKELLVKSIEAIYNQTYTDWHLYLIDDGSEGSNRAYNIISPQACRDKVTLVYKPNGGVSSARNTALALINQATVMSYIAFCDSDDVWDKNYLEEQVKALENTDLVYSSVRHRFIDGSVAVPYGISDFTEYPGIAELRRGNFIFISGVVLKRSCLSVGYFDPALNSIEDWDYWIRVARANYRIAKNPNTCFSYTVKTNGNGSRSNKEVYEKFHEKHKY